MLFDRASTDAARDDPDASLALCVLASGSSGNCSLLVSRVKGQTRLTLIDLGVSPRRVRRLLAQFGFELEQVSGALLTHLDSDHFQPTWAAALPERVKLHIHKRHRARAQRLGALHRPTHIFEEAPFMVSADIEAHPLHMSHDQLGVAAFRLEHTAATLGFATDVGCVTPEFIEHFRAVDVMAIESNYCPRMQIASARPDFLKQRVMGGGGHLSNQQSARAVKAIAPRRAVVLLHLSRQCNTPELALETHAEHACPAALTWQHKPSEWIPITPTAATPIAPQLPLFQRPNSLCH
jgi:phosphoribosyl 1,2-cyclic phosphodiesterase